jgi:hypothetical protein
MHLVQCVAPRTWLVPAPLTALCRPSEGESWDGFWSGERDKSGRETYFVRCTGTDGSVRWYVMEDAGSESSSSESRTARTA